MSLSYSVISSSSTHTSQHIHLYCSNFSYSRHTRVSQSKVSVVIDTPSCGPLAASLLIHFVLTRSFITPATFLPWVTQFSTSLSHFPIQHYSQVLKLFNHLKILTIHLHVTVISSPCLLPSPYFRPHLPLNNITAHLSKACH